MAGVIRNLVVLSMLYPMTVQAGIYICKDAAGRTLTSDRPIPECADRPIREYSNKGVFRREIAAPPTPQERRVLDEQRRQRQAEEEALVEQRRSDRALMARYRSEDEVEMARQRESATLANLIVQQKASLQIAKNEWRAAAGNKPRQDLAAERVHEITASIHDSELDLEQLNAKYDSVLKRYRELADMASR